MDKAAQIPRLENDQVRVSEWRFAPGEATGHHRHGFDYVVVPLTAGTLKLVDRDGESRAELTPGGAYFRPAGVEHDVINAGSADLAFVEIEFLQRPG